MVVAIHSRVTQSLIKGTETALTGGYGRRITEAYDNGEFGAAAGNLLAGMAYGAMNLATLGEAGAVASCPLSAAGANKGREVSQPKVS